MGKVERETAAGPQNIILEGRKALHVSGVTEVTGFREQEVSMKTLLGELTVRGEGLHVETLTVERGELRVSGRVDSLSYRDRRGGRR